MTDEKLSDEDVAYLANALTNPAILGVYARALQAARKELAELNRSYDTLLSEKIAIAGERNDAIKSRDELRGAFEDDDARYLEQYRSGTYIPEHSLPALDRAIACARLVRGGGE